MKYFAICCKLGHQGRGRYQEITFAIKAYSIVEAIDQARTMPGVKHNNPTCILYSKEITYKEYVVRRQVSAYSKFKRY